MARVTRRDFVRGSFAAVLATLAPGLLGPGGRVLAEPDEPPWPRAWSLVNADPPALFELAHRIRQGEFDAAELASADGGDPVFDLIVVGGGMSGLAAALAFRDRGEADARVLVLENHAEPGGNARRESFEIGGRVVHATQAAAYIEEPWTDGQRAFYRRLGVDLDRVRVPRDADRALFDAASHGCEPKWVERIWTEGWANAPVSDDERRALTAFVRTVARLGSEQERADWARLDQSSFREWIEEERGWPRAVTRFADLYCRDLLGAPAGAVSAATAIQFCAGMTDAADIYSFPGGTSGFARAVVEALVPDALPGATGSAENLAAAWNREALDRPGAPVRVRLNATAVRVAHEGDPDAAEHVRVTYVHEGRLFHVRARAAILAGGGFMARRIVRDLPAAHREAFAQFRYGAYLVANVGLRTSAAIDRAGLGFQGCLFDGLASTFEIADWVSEGGKERRDPARPNVLTFFCALTDPEAPPAEQGPRGRARLLGTSFAEFEALVLRDLGRILAPWGLEPERDVVALTLNRWGHAMVTASPGFAYALGPRGEPRPGPCRQAAAPYGRIAFAHTDLAGSPYLEAAVAEGTRAAHEAARRLR